MRNILVKRILPLIALLFSVVLRTHAVDLWVGQSYDWDFSGSVMGSVYNMNVSTSGGYLSVTGSGFHRVIKPTQYFGGSTTVTAEWDYALYHGAPMSHQRVTLTVTCKENPVSISPTSVTLSPGQTYQLSYRHAYDNEYVSAANTYFSGGNSSFSVTSSGLITAIAPGSGYVNVYSKISDASKAPCCLVTIKEVEPTSASISDFSIEADKSISISLNVSPSNATVKTTSWSVESGSDVVSVSSSGYLTALKPGKAKISCLVNGSVRSNTATVTVYEPSLTFQSSKPGDGATDVSAFVSPVLTFSHNIYRSAAFEDIALSSSKGKVDGSVSISGQTLTFVPAKPLEESVKYTLTVPAGAVKNKWDTPYGSNLSISFTTGEYERLSLELSPVDGSYITKDVTPVTLKCSNKDAVIRYTVDGTVPSRDNGKIYTAPLTFSSDVTVKAVAMLDGYKDSEIVQAAYFISALAMASVYPDDSNPPYVYKDVNPHILFDGNILPNDNFRKITLTDESDGHNVGGKVATWLNLLVFMPDEDLKPGTKYTMNLPRNSIVTENGESNREISWSFTTRNIVQSLSASGDCTGLLIDEKSQLKSWGLSLSSLEPSTAYYGFDNVSLPKDLSDDVVAMSSGLMHSLYLTGDGTLKGFGRAYCSELARDFAAASQSTVVVADDVTAFSAGAQTTALIKSDKSLYMLGRNDFGQIGDSTRVKADKPVKILDDVSRVACGLGFTMAVKNDGTLWAWGRNDRGQLGDGTTIDRLVPVKVAEGVDNVFVSSCGGKTVAALMSDGRLQMWGDNSFGQLGMESTSKFSPSPVEVNLTGISKVALGTDYALFLNNDNELYAVGSNSNRQIPGTTETKLVSPALVLKYVADVAVGNGSTLVLGRDGTVSGCGRHRHALMGETESPSVFARIFDGVPYAQITGVRPCFSNIRISLESTLALPVYPVPVEADYQEIKWAVENPAILSVDEYGVIEPLEYGKTDLTVTISDKWRNSFSAKINVEVTDHDDIVGVSMLQLRKWNAFANKNILTISNMTIGETYVVYNMQGIVIKRFKADDSHVTIDLPSEGIYIVCSGDDIVKLLNR